MARRRTRSPNRFAMLAAIATTALGCGAAPDDLADAEEIATLEAELTPLAKACTPKVTIDLQDQGPKGKLFLAAVGGKPKKFVQAIGRTVCKILYRKPGEVRPASHVTLHIQDYDGVAGKWGDVGDIDVRISTRHLKRVHDEGGDVAEEIRGILLHEMTHMYQNDDRAPGEGTYPRLGEVLEGVADFVRFRAAHAPEGRGPDKSGEWEDEGYTKPAFFLLWVDRQYPGFVYRMNLGMKAGDGKAWGPASFKAITKKTVDELWDEYQDAACCSGTSADEQTCCD